MSTVDRPRSTTKTKAEKKMSAVSFVMDTRSVPLSGNGQIEAGRYLNS